MKKTIKMKTLAICSLLATTVLAGCSDSESNVVAKETPKAEKPQETSEVQSSVKDESSQDVKDAQHQKPEVIDHTTDFDKALISFVEDSGFAEKNYMVSPTSFRAALSLAVAGADTKTKDELIRAMGFSSMDEVNEWYTSVTGIISDFDAAIEIDKKNFEESKKWLPKDAKSPEGALVMMNSIWNNTDLNGKFAKKYLKYVADNYKAEANNVTSDNITDKVNKWINKGTNGLIPTISNDLSEVNAVLVNTLYLKSSWLSTFDSYLTSSDSFTTINGEKVEKDFMHQQDRFRFYEDENGKLLVLPLNGGIDAVFVLGSFEDFRDAMDKAYSDEVIVKLPKFDIETSFSENEFIAFLQSRGAGLAFTQDADFSVMCPDTSWLISDIIQKTRIKIDEDGLEAAAATAIMMTESALVEESKPKEFIADQPFKFYICGGENDSEILFAGQVVE